MKQYTCPNCHVKDTEFTVVDGTEKNITIEEEYNDKVKKFEEIIFNHNNKPPEHITTLETHYKFGIVPINVDVYRLKKNYKWCLYTIESSLKFNNRKIIISEIHEESFPFNNPIEKEYEVFKYISYKYIECKTCGYKHYI